MCLYTLELIPESIGIFSNSITSRGIFMCSIIIRKIASPECIVTFEFAIKRNILKCTVGNKVTLWRRRIFGRKKIINDILCLRRCSKRLISVAGSDCVIISGICPHKVSGCLIIRRQRNIYLGESCQTLISNCSGSRVFGRRRRRRCYFYQTRTFTTNSVKELGIQRVVLG